MPTNPLHVFEFSSHFTTLFLYRYFSSTVTKDERSEQTPEGGEGGIVATKTARKLQLDDVDDDDDDIVIMSSKKREDVPPPFLPSSSAVPSPPRRSPFRKSPQATASYLEMESEVSVRKQLFPSNRSSERLSSFRFSGSKNLSSSAKAGGKNPFALLDQSQKFTGGADSENKKCFVLTNNPEDVDISSQENSILPQTDYIEIHSDQDTDPSLHNPTGETIGSGGVESKSTSFSYNMSSKDFITAHPCTHGQPSINEKPAMLQRSQSVAEMMLQPAIARATSSQPLVGSERNAPLSNRRGSAIPSTNSAKVCHPK
jgi:hypothetical protein